MASPTTAMAMALPTMDTDMAIMDMPVMPTPTVTMDTMARGLLMLRLPPLLRPMPMLTTVPMDMALLTTAMDTASPTTVMPTMDTDMPTVMPTPMPTTDTMARGLLMLPPLLMLTMVLMAMVSPTTDTAMAMDMPTTAMPTMDTTDIPMPPDTTDIINLLIFVKN